MDGKYLVLVNRKHRISEDWNEHVELEKAGNCDGEEFLVEKETLRALNELKADFLKEGVKIEIDSSYRSIAMQQHIWEWDLEHRGEEYTRQYVALAGYSEHHTGLAVDIYVDKNGTRVYRDKDGNNYFKPLIHPRIASYGFILRYPEGKEEITGYSYEPWHLRYVGSKKIASEIYEKGITLEEYLGDI